MRTPLALVRKLTRSQLLPSHQHDDLKHSIRVSQIGPAVMVRIELSNDAMAERLLVRHFVGEWIPVGAFELVEERATTRVFEAHLSFEDAETVERIALAYGSQSRADVSLRSPQPRPLELFFEVEAPVFRIVENAQPNDRVPNPGLNDPLTQARALLALGRFARTELVGLEKYSTIDDEYLIFATAPGNLALAATTMPRPYVKVQIDKARIESDEIHFVGTLFTRHTEPSDFQFTLLGRDTGVVVASALTVTEDVPHSVTSYGHRSYHVQATISLREFLSDEVTDDVFTAWISSRPKGSDEVHRARVGVSRYLVRRRANESWMEDDGRAALVSMYYTFQANNLSLYVERFDPLQLKKMLDWIEHPRSRPVRQPGQKPVWLIGEQNYKAQDTGLAFFRFMREHHQEVDAYYVIAEDAADKVNLIGLDHIVNFRSVEHFELFFRAERLIGSHHPEYIYPSKSRMLKGAVTTVRVFLQHGVFGVRRLDKLYGRHAPGFHTDLFIVSSEREKRNAITDLGYRANEVAVTGLSRFDTLFDGKTPVKPRQVLIMPTWREWLQSDHSFADSLYFERWSGLLTSPRLLQILQDHSAEAVLFLHPNMRKFADQFENSRVRLVRQGEESVQNLLKESAVLVTDYSSVGFDFSFLYKPVLYYQFDSGRFLSEGSHIDMDTELPGPITWSQKTLLDSLADTLRHDAAIDPEYARRVDALAAYRDTNNCERIYTSISRTGRRSETLPERHTEVLRSVERIARKQKMYIPVMKRVFNLLRLLPLDDQIVVFESSRGKEMGDSPKAIYDELVRRGDTRTKVWLLNRKSKVSDEHTRVVSRFTPAYFWYLARAKYWVSNQHLPPYLSRRNKGVFLQTWHGTPLKKMMHDHDYAAVQDETLLERYSEAVAQWTHLVSPSPFATEAFSSAFRHQAEVVEVGYPRNDSLQAPNAGDVAARTRQKLGIPPQKKSVLYAPTFRDDKPAGGNQFYYDPPFKIEELAEALGKDHVLLVRLHGLTKNKIQVPDAFVDRVIDVSTYPSLNELFLASDALITDYSSLFFDYVVLQRPVVLFPYDLETYRDEVRGLYLDYYRDLPFPVVTELGGLRDALEQESSDSQDRARFLERFAPHEDGESARRVVDRVFGTS